MLKCKNEQKWGSKRLFLSYKKKRLDIIIGCKLEYNRDCIDSAKDESQWASWKSWKCLCPPGNDFHTPITKLYDTDTANKMIIYIIIQNIKIIDLSPDANSSYEVLVLRDYHSLWADSQRGTFPLQSRGQWLVIDQRE